MSLFSGLKKHLKKGLKIIKPIAKLAIKTAPIWTNFIPGGSAANTIIGRVAPLLDKAKSIRTKLRSAGGTQQLIGSVAARFGGHSRAASAILGGMKFREMALKSGREEDAYYSQTGATHHAGIRGPVAQRFGPMHSHLQALRMGGPRPRARRRAAPARRRRSSARYRTSSGRFTKRRRRAA